MDEQTKETVLELHRQARYDTNFNAMIKLYKSGMQTTMIADRRIFRKPGWEKREQQKRKLTYYEWLTEAEKSIDSDFDDNDPLVALRDCKEYFTRQEDNLERARRRARNKVKDLVLSGNYSHFATLTFDQKKVDRYNLEAVLKAIKDWLGNRVRRAGLNYVLIPELHKDGAVHMHGFISAYDAGRNFADSGHKDKGGRIIYNLTDWPFGFTNITAIDSLEKACSYTLKYITKDSKKLGGRWYYSGGQKVMPERVYLNLDFEAAAEEEAGTEIYIRDIGANIVIL